MSDNKKIEIITGYDDFMRVSEGWSKGTSGWDHQQLVASALYIAAVMGMAGEFTVEYQRQFPLGDDVDDQPRRWWGSAPHALRAQQGDDTSHVQAARMALARVRKSFLEMRK